MWGNGDCSVLEDTSTSHGSLRVVLGMECNYMKFLFDGASFKLLLKIIIVKMPFP